MGIPSPYKPSRFISPLKARQLQRALNNLKLSMICGLLTILVLRGALGAGKYGTPVKDFEEIKHQFERVQSLHTRKHASRVLAEVIEERHRPQEAIEETQAHSTTYDVLEDTEVQNNDEPQAKYALIDGNSDVKSKKPYALSPQVSDWDVQRRDWLRANPNLVGGKPRVMLVTGYHPSACENPTGDHYLLKFIKNKVEYCKLHGIEVLYNSAFLEAEVSGFGAKFHLLRKHMLTHPEVEWFWWMDSDAMFTDMAFELPMEKYENYNLVLHGWDDMIYKQKNWVGLTSGSFLIRNCQWSLNKLDAWVSMEPEGQVPDDASKLLARRSNSEAGDQPEFAHLLIKENQHWGDKVPSVHLHGYWKIPVVHSEEEMGKNHEDVTDERWPFVTRFVRCKLPKKGTNADDYNADVCFKHMERAFNFADSQVLQLNNVQHKPSSSSALRHLRGGHDSILVPHYFPLISPSI